MEQHDEQDCEAAQAVESLGAAPGVFEHFPQPWRRFAVAPRLVKLPIMPL
jgi:hypothetical protein